MISSVSSGEPNVKFSIFERCQNEFSSDMSLVTEARDADIAHLLHQTTTLSAAANNPLNFSNSQLTFTHTGTRPIYISSLKYHY